MADQPTLITSVVRALTLLEAVSQQRRPVTAKRLARLSGIPLPTTYHLLRTLVHQGYLLRTQEGYVVGDQPSRLARARDEAATSQRVNTLLRTLHDELSAAAYLAVLVDGEVELVDIVDSPTAPRADLWVGLHEAAHATALGKAIIGALPDDGRHDYLLRHPLADLTRHTHTSVRSLLAELDERPGIVVDAQEYELGTTCVAVPIPGPHLIGAVAVSVPDADADRILSRVRSIRRAAHLIGLAHAADPSS